MTTPEHVSVYSDGNSTEADLLNRMNSSDNNNEPKQRKILVINKTVLNTSRRMIRHNFLLDDSEFTTATAQGG